MDLGPVDIGLVLLAVMVLFGYRTLPEALPEALPDASRSLGRSLRISRREVGDLRADPDPSSREVALATGHQATEPHSA